MASHYKMKWIPHCDEVEPKYLVNYTSEKNGKKIIEGGRILFRNFFQTNDPRDYNICSNKNIFKEPSHEYYPKYYNDWVPFAEKHLFAYYLSHKGDINDYKESVKNILLWAHYGDSQKGICFVYNTAKLKKICNSVFEKSIIRPIHYRKPLPQYDDSFLIPREVQDAENHNNAMAEYIFEDFNNFHFYEKHEDWTYEKEIRILAYHEEETNNNEIFVNIEDCIEAVVLGDRFDSDSCSLCKLKPILKEKMVCEKSTLKD